MRPIAVNESSYASSSQSGTPGWTHWLTLVFLVGGGTFARFYCAACKPFWFDECFSVELARIDWPNFLHLMWWREANMSLYYLLLRVWIHFGQTPFFIRTLSVVISAATLIALYWLAKLLCGHRTALLATSLLAINAYSIRYAQEARTYALFVFLAILSSGFFISFLRMPSRSSRLAFILFSTLAVYAHFYGLLLIAAQWLTLRWSGVPFSDSGHSRNETCSQMKHAWTAVAIAVLPLLIFVGKTGAGPIKWIPRPGFGDLWHFSKDFTNGLPLLYSLACLPALLPLRNGIKARAQDWETWRVRFLLVWFLFPISLTLTMSFIRPVFLPRYMIFCIPPLLILAAMGLSNFRPGWLGGASFAFLLLLSAPSVPFVYSHDFDTERDGSGSASNFILDNSQPGDGIIFHIAETRIPYEFFRSLRAGTDSAVPTFEGKLGPQILFPRHGAGLDYRDFTGKPTEELIREGAGKNPRIWLMLMNNGPADKPDATTVMLSRTIPESLPKVRRWQFPRVEVRLYSRQ